MQGSKIYVLIQSVNQYKKENAAAKGHCTLERPGHTSAELPASSALCGPRFPQNTSTAPLFFFPWNNSTPPPIFFEVAFIFLSSDLF